MVYNYPRAHLVQSDHEIFMFDILRDRHISDCFSRYKAISNECSNQALDNKVYILKKKKISIWLLCLLDPSLTETMGVGMEKNNWTLGID